MKIRFTRVLLFMLLFSTAVFAQQFTGRVTDSSGATLPKVKVTVHNVAKNTDVTTTTTSSGDYTVPYLIPGLYDVSVVAPSFKKEIKEHITLEVGQVATVNFALTVGAITESVIVNSDAAILDFGKGDRGEVVENTRVTELPLNGRDPGMLSLLNAGVIWTNWIGYQRPFDDTQSNLAINGGGSGNNELMLDGVSNESSVGGNSQISYVPPIDSVQEFKIVTNPYDAQYGRASGGVVDMNLKSGTNRIHGDVYEFARRTWLDANTWQNDYYNSVNKGHAKGSHKLDQYGAELDGPVFVPKIYNGKDKSFFLLQYENWNEVVPNIIVASVPDPKWLTGDFSNMTYWDGKKYAPITIYDPLTLHDNGKGVLVRNPFPGNVIPAGRLNPTSSKLLSYYPKPNTTPPPASNPFSNNFTTPNPTTDRYRNVLGKFDQNLTSRDRFTLRYGYWERIEIRGTNGMPGAAASGQLPYGERSHAFATEWVHTFTPSLLFDFRASVGDRANFAAGGPAGFDETSIGWSAQQVKAFGTSGHVFPNMSISEFAGLGNGGASESVGNSLNMMPNLTWIKNKHTFHAGMDARFLQNANTEVGGGPHFWVDRQWSQMDYRQWDYASGNSISSMLLGTMSSGGVDINPHNFWSQHYYAPFVQDDWKITSRLTLNLGIRYDLNGAKTERHNGADYIFDINATNPVQGVNLALLPGGVVKGGMTFLGVNGKPRSPYALVKTNIQPRVGFAYALDNLTVIRGGVGEMLRNPTPGPNQYGFSSSTGYQASLDGNKTPYNSITNPFPTVIQPTGSSLGMLTGIGQGPWYLNPNYKPPTFWSYSLGVQRQFLSHDTIEIGYVGSRTLNNDSSLNVNPESLAYAQQCNMLIGGSRAICDNDYKPNPFQNVAAFQGTGYYNASTIQGGNFTRPAPAFGDITVWQKNDGKSWYNSLQTTAMHKWSNSLTMHGTWTWSKMMNAGGFHDQTYGVLNRNLDGNDRTHRVTVSGVYVLPVGRGRKILGSANRLVDTAIGGWELASLYVYETGTPWGTPMDRYVHSAWVPRSIIPSNGYIRGVEPCVAQYLEDKNGNYPITPLPYSTGCKQYDFIQNPGYAAGTNVVYTGIRLPNDHQFDANLSKNFSIVESLKLQFRLEAFNVLNHPLWQSGYQGSANDPNFGTIERGPWGQSNKPREVQLALKLMW